ncbi:restriction endonuclease subunit S [Phytobacter sp. MRY16-398]|uniref:restriction endonuclease subunit S n=1 Tax=Phytobacter sp. MRY16-398 TaxID=2487150 RepID=UPI000DF6283A|nr:restriction endonuclease subunit S [Phytobacter sp. MRY16-398]MDU4153661.1 restriction endonuclease subunit S [Enterobacteriaceae bacterium]MDU7381488.1 restriction endonuclease subunit S [Enterobacteriaceae bacterium]BBE77007.1 type I restriction endonuclease subunit S [Phytobacter sp. MRY16-398]
MVPKGWQKYAVGELCTSIVPGRNKPKVFDGDIPWVTTPEINGRYIPSKLQVNYVSTTALSDAGGKIVPKGAVVMAAVGELGLIAITSEPVVLNQQLHAFVCSKLVNNEFLAYWLTTQKPYMESIASKTTIPYMNKTNCESIPVLLPPLVEQFKIAQILSTWDKAISVTEKFLANSQQQKKALMQQLITGKKRLLDEKGERFSGEWEYTIFGNLGDTYTGLTGKTKEDFGAGKPYIPYINIFKNSRIDIQSLEYVQVNDDERQSVVKYGDIFFTTSSETPEEVGMSSVLLEGVSEVFLNSFCFGFRLNNFETLIPEYARYLFRSEHVRRQISTLGQGATRYNLSKRQLIKLELKLPCVDEQQKIATVLSVADDEITTLEKKLACLKDEKKALMQQLLTGKRRVKVDEAVAA